MKPQKIKDSYYFKFKCDVFPFELSVFIGNDKSQLQEIFSQKFGKKVDPPNLKGAATECTIYDTNGSIFPCIFLPYDPDSVCETLEYLTHEIQHALVDISDHLGLKITGKHSETGAYLFGYLYSTCFKHLAEIHEKCSNPLK